MSNMSTVAAVNRLEESWLLLLLVDCSVQKTSQLCRVVTGLQDKAASVQPEQHICHDNRFWTMHAVQYSGCVLVLPAACF
jgi:hypothetical protein